MRFYEFGKENEPTLMLLHGLASTWEKSFGKCIPMLAEKYHVIAVGMDGHDPTDNTEYISAEDEAEKIAEFINDKLGGSVYAIYAASLGCAAALSLFFGRKVIVEKIILDGAEKMTYGPFTRLFANFMAKMGYKMARGKSKLLLRMMGVTQDMLGELMYTGATLNTLKNGCYEAMTFYPKIPKSKTYSDVMVACWYGSKETLVPSGVKALKKVFPYLEEKPFDGYAHGEILNHPEQLKAEIDRFFDSSNLQRPTNNLSF